MPSLKNPKRIVFLIPYPLDVAPGQRFRFEQYLSLLRANGHTCEILSFLAPATNDILYTPGNFVRKAVGVLTGFMNRLICLPSLRTADFVFIFREASALGPPLFEWVIARWLRKKIIYDFDDAIWLPNTTQENKIIAWLKWHSKVSSICRWSFRVSAGNAYLADYAKQFNSNVVVQPTTIDTDHLHNPARYNSTKGMDRVVIGWTGTHSTLHYLSPMVPLFETLSKKYPNLRVVVIADRKPSWNLACMEFIQWTRETEIMDLLKLDIGLMPLTDDAWSKGKCGFKALQYMSLEIPALVSPVGVTTSIVDHGVNGFVCSTENQWAEAIEMLIRDTEKRQTMGRKGRLKVIEHYSVASNASRFLSLFE